MLTYLVRTFVASIRRHATPVRVLWASVCFAALLAVALGIAVRAGGPTAAQVRRLVGRAAPAFTLPAEQAGHPLSAPVALPDAHARPTLLVFFYSLCPHCPSSMAAARQIERESASLRVLYMDSPAEDAGIVDAYAQRLGVHGPILLDAGGRIAAAFGAQASPTLVLVNARSIVQQVWTGETDAGALRQALRTVERMP